MSRLNYCRTKKPDCSDCDFNKNHKAADCDYLYNVYVQGAKEFAERLKDKCGLVIIGYDGENTNFEEHVCYQSDIDETLKEMKLD